MLVAGIWGALSSPKGPRGLPEQILRSKYCVGCGKTLKDHFHEPSLQAGSLSSILAAFIRWNPGSWWSQEMGWHRLGRP